MKHSHAELMEGHREPRRQSFKKFWRKHPRISRLSRRQRRQGALELWRRIR